MAIKTKAKTKKTYQPQVSGILDFISPSVINFESKIINIGSQYATTMVITHFPNDADAGWLSRIVTMPGVTASIHINPTDPLDLIQSINVSMGEYEGRLITGGNALQVQRAKKGFEDAEKLLQKIDQEQQQVSFMTVTLLIRANDKEKLNERIKQVTARLASAGMRGRIPIFKQEEGLRTVGPWGIIEDDIYQIGARNMPSESIAGAYPFVYSGLNDGKGVLLGQDQTGGIVLVDFWKRGGDRTNSNLTIMGKPGVGKSSTVKKILLAENAFGTKIIIIDPEREYKDTCENLNGTWIDCGGGGRGRINPLQVRLVPLDDDDDKDRMYSKEIVESGPLAMHFQTLRTFFKLYLETIDKERMAYLEIALEKTYNNAEIYWDTDPSTIPNDRWPIIRDLHQVIEDLYEKEKDPQWKTLAMLLRSAAVGADSALWSGPTTIEIDSDFIVLDINRLLEADKNILRAQFFNLLGWTWNEISKNRIEQVLLGVDEAYLLADPEEPQALQFLRNTSKRIRKYEGGIMVITHNLVDFLDPAIRRYGQALIDNPAYKIIMGQGEKDIESLTKLMTLSEMEVQTIQQGNRGEAIFIAGNKRLQVNIEIEEHEEVMFGRGGGR